MSSTLEYLRTQKRDEILALAQQYGISNVRVFGSVAREDDTPDSDIDFLVTWKKNSNLQNWFKFWDSLEQSLDQKIDVVQENNLHWYLKPQIIAEAKPL